MNIQKNSLKDITRLELIDSNGRNNNIEISLQDNDRTLKIFTKNPTNIKSYIEREIEDISINIIGKAIDYYENTGVNGNKEDLFDIDMNKEPIISYNQEDRENHSYDLGKLVVLNNILKMINNES